jgi:hypothetical protein
LPCQQKQAPTQLQPRLLVSTKSAKVVNARIEKGVNVKSARDVNAVNDMISTASDLSYC